MDYFQGARRNEETVNCSRHLRNDGSCCVCAEPTPPTRPSTAGAGQSSAAQTQAEAPAPKAKSPTSTQPPSDREINDLKAKLDVLNGEFEPKKKEIQALEEELQQPQEQDSDPGQHGQSLVRNQWVEEATEKEKGLKRKAEDYDALGQKRLAEVSQPVYEKVGKLLEQYCQQRGIVLVLEAAPPSRPES
ncbi:MAG: OmpH family outer membrane protein [Acidobacteria bacterium]|nr:OmpH family outer membrane protein [Acidobacteriota bacterium]